MQGTKTSSIQLKNLLRSVTNQEGEEEEEEKLQDMLS